MWSSQRPSALCPSMPGPGGKQERGWGGLAGGFRRAAPSPALQLPRSSDLASSVRGSPGFRAGYSGRGGTAAALCAAGPAWPCPPRPGLPVVRRRRQAWGARCCVARAAGFSRPPSLPHSAGVWGGKTRRRSRKEGRSAHRGDTVTHGPSVPSSATRPWTAGTSGGAPAAPGRGPGGHGKPGQTRAGGPERSQTPNRGEGRALLATPSSS